MEALRVMLEEPTPHTPAKKGTSCEDGSEIPSTPATTRTATSTASPNPVTTTPTSSASAVSHAGSAASYPSTPSNKVGFPESKRGRRPRTDEQFNLFEWLDTHYPAIYVPLSKPGGGDQVVSVAGVGGERYAMTAQQLLNGMTPSRRAKIPIWCKVCVRSFLGQRLSTAWFVGIHDKSDLHKANAKTAGVAITDYPDAPPDLTEQVPCTGILVTDGTRAWHSMA